MANEESTDADSGQFRTAALADLWKPYLVVVAINYSHTLRKGPYGGLLQHWPGVRVYRGDKFYVRIINNLHIESEQAESSYEMCLQRRRANKNSMPFHHQKICKVNKILCSLLKCAGRFEPLNFGVFKC